MCTILRYEAYLHFTHRPSLDVSGTACSEIDGRARAPLLVRRTAEQGVDCTEIFEPIQSFRDIFRPITAVVIWIRRE
ncbi:uncharacterized protein H6S33_001341 [Morchella sextelata]|uniref:uncharacterized protein n=1 Tax=Morchella sextelata TaxID=1174677 RepID=UPI001D03674A|nr:uncharacterized protein H6S33_001341 [Morchella sextelata]KAH0609113.1 hypothetical protein H6S33_001341 [Morchella sextelata]